jgi:hypothetical protein
MKFAAFFKSDHFIILAAAICMLVSGYFLFYDDMQGGGGASTTRKIGEINYSENDTRLKSKDSLIWYKAAKMQGIHIGDAIYAGNDSSALVRLDKGGDITVREKSMVVFSDVEQNMLADLEKGSFLIKVDGSVKIGIRGKLTTLEGNNSEIQIKMGENHKAQLTLVSGEASVTMKDKAPVELDSSVATVIDIPAPPPAVVEIAATIDKLAKIEDISYRWLFEDLYEQSGATLIERPAQPEKVAAVAKLNWSTSKATPATIEISNTSDFENVIAVDSKSGSAEVSPVFLGKNYWRVSLNKNVSETQKFFVQADFLKNAAPKASSLATNIPLIDGRATQSIDLEPTVTSLGYVIETSMDPSFSRAKTQFAFSNSTKVDIALTAKGDHFYRFRAVSMKQELSEWSKVLKFKVYVPALPSSPILAHAKLKGIVGDDFSSAWTLSGEGQVKSEITDENGEVVAEMTGEKATWKSKEVGKFKLKAYAVNEYGQRGPSSKTVELLVDQVPVRVPASVAPVAAVKANAPLEGLHTNEQYKSSVVAFESFLWTMQSSQQYFQNQTAPMAAGLGIHGMLWWEKSGLEGSVKSGVKSLNKSGNTTSIEDMEVRYHYRFFTPLPFARVREMQISAFGGAEIYRNSNNILFVGSYKLAKAGVNIEFPWGESWSAGGEVVGGLTNDGSNKEEVSGQVSYFMNRRWSIGIGYRVHLFQAGSAASAPGGSLPYREGYTEGYSVFNYHF